MQPKERLQRRDINLEINPEIIAMTTAIVFGASGFIGSNLLDILLADPGYTKVIAVVRKPLSIDHPRLSVLIGDFASLPALAPQLVADEVYIALGTTRAKTPDEADYYITDHDYPVRAATIAKASGATSLFVVTAVGADATSRFFYVRTKGETERDIIKIGFDHTHIFRPSMILGQRAENRPRERMIIAAWNVLNPLLMGPLDHYRGLTGGEIARAMSLAAKRQTERVRIYHWREMTGLLRGARATGR